MESLVDIFSAKKYNWEAQNSDQFNKQNAPFDIVYNQVKQQLVEENVKKAPPKVAATTMNPRATSSIGPKAVVALNSKSNHQQQLQQAKQNENASLTQLITQAKKSAAGK